MILYKRLNTIPNIAAVIAWKLLFFLLPVEIILVFLVT